MGTRSFIGIENSDGHIVSIYCGWDGSPDVQASILLKGYPDASKITALLTLGDLATLGPEIGEKHAFNDFSHPLWCTAYTRDRGDAWRFPLHSNNRTAYLAQASRVNASYAYLFADDAWYVCKVSNSHLVEAEWHALNSTTEVPNHA